MIIKLFIFLVFMAVNCGAERIHENKCREYQRIANENSCVEKRTNLTVSGELVTVTKGEEFPHIGILGFYNHDEKNETVWRCQGVLISERFVLTTAHCIRNDFLGDLNYVRLKVISYKKYDVTKPDDYQIKAVHRHPEYKTSYYYYNIALVKLDRDVIFGKDLIPACLPTAIDYSTETFILSVWWGYEWFYELIQKIVKKISDEDCEKQYQTFDYKQLKNGFQKEIQLCVESQNRIREGYLFVDHQTENCMFSVVALPEFHNINMLPLVKVRVLSFVDWIEGIVWS